MEKKAASTIRLKVLVVTPKVVGCGGVWLTQPTYRQIEQTMTERAASKKRLDSV